MAPKVVGSRPTGHPNNQKTLFMSKIVIVNKNNEVIGAEERDVVTEKRLIRRIARVFLFDSEGRLYL